MDSKIPVKAAIAVGKKSRSPVDEGLPPMPLPPVALAVVWVMVVNQKLAVAISNSLHFFL